MAKVISSLSVVLGANVGGFVSRFGQAGSVAAKFNTQLKGIGAGANITNNLNVAQQAAGNASSAFSILKFSILRTISATAAFAAVWGTLKTMSGGLHLVSEVEMTTMALETMLGSADQARVMLDQLFKFAATTPFNFQDVSKSAKQLIAYGFAAGNVAQNLKMLGDIAAGVGAPLNDIVYLYGTLRTQGRAYAIDIRQFAQRGIPIYQALAKVMGVSAHEIPGLVKAGEVGFPEVKAALESLTASGGRFHDMTAKLSQTLPGLWETLSDNIGMSFTKTFLKMAELFHLKDALRAMISGTNAIREWLSNAMDKYAALVVSYVGMVWGEITSIFKAIYAFVAPIVTAIGNFIADNWQTILADGIEVFSAIYNFIALIVGAIYTSVVTIIQGVVAIWDWGMGMLGYDTLQFGDKATTTTQKVVGAFTWLAHTISGIVNVMTYTLKNFQLGFTILGLAAAYELAKLGNKIEYFFTYMDALSDYGGRNAFQIIATISNYIAAFFENTLTNAENFATALFDLLQGKGWHFDWTELSKGYKSAMVEAFEAPERQIGASEAGLYDMLQSAQDQYVAGLQDSMNEQAKVAKNGATDAINGVNSVMDKFREASKVEPPKLPDVKLPTDEEDDADTSKSEATKQGRGHHEDNAPVRANSAQAQALQYQRASGLVYLADLTKAGNDLQKKNNADTERIRRVAEDGNNGDGDVGEGDI